MKAGQLEAASGAPGHAMSGVRSPWSPRGLPAAIADLFEQVDQAVDALGAGRHQPQALHQALDVSLVEGDALNNLASRESHVFSRSPSE